MPGRKIGEEGVELIKGFEGLKLEAYVCPGRKWSIGYGHTNGVKKGDKITKEVAEDLLREDLEKFEEYVNRAVKVELNQNQFDALVSWTYNLGPGNLANSTMLKKLNTGDYESVASEMQRWNKSGGKVLAGLVRRRESEAQLFCKPIEARVSILARP